MALSKSILKRIIREELVRSFKASHLYETLAKEDYPIIRDIIRNEVAAILFDLFRKRNVWI